jgi:hypothetical protein
MSIDAFQWVIFMRRPEESSLAKGQRRGVL